MKISFCTQSKKLFMQMFLKGIVVTRVQGPNLLKIFTKLSLIFVTFKAPFQKITISNKKFTTTYNLKVVNVGKSMFHSIGQKILNCKKKKI